MTYIDTALRDGRAGRIGGMSILLEKQVAISRTVSMSGQEARALADKTRRLIAKILYRQTMCTAEISDALADKGMGKAVPTVRHHMDVLREAGVIEVVKIVTVRGTVEKYYTAAIKLLDYKAPEDLDGAHSAEIEMAARKMARALNQLAPRIANKIPGDMAEPEYEQFILAEVINRALTRVFEDSGADGGEPGAGPRRASAS